MSESVIADFVGQFNSEAANRSDPAKGRVVLSQKRLVLAASEDDKLTIPLESIFDIAIGQVPPDLGDFFKSTVTVAFKKNGKQLVAAIEAGDEKIQKFGTVLFKAIINGTGTKGSSSISRLSQTSSVPSARLAVPTDRCLSSDTC